MRHLNVFTALLLSLSSVGFASTTIRAISLQANDIVYDSRSQRIYASVPSKAGAQGNSIAVIDPVAGVVEKTVFIGSEPAKMVLSDDGQFLYVALNGAAAVRRLDLTTLTPGLQFPLGSDPSDGALYASDMAVIPGKPESVAVARAVKYISPSAKDVAVYDDGVQRGASSGCCNFISEIAFGDDPSTLYGESERIAVIPLKIDANGVTAALTISNSDADAIYGEMAYDHGLIYLSDGDIFNPSDNQYVGRFSGVDFDSQMAFDRTDGRIYFADKPSDQPFRFLAYDPLTLAPLGSVILPDIGSVPLKVIRWGADGLAFIVNGTQIDLIDTSLTPSPVVTDLSVTQTASPNPVTLGSDLIYHLTVANHGSSKATGVSLRDQLPPEVSYVIAGASQGSCAESQEYRAAPDLIVCNLRDLEPNASATVTLTGFPQRGGLATNQAGVAALEKDSNETDNVSDLTLSVELGLSPDRSGTIDLSANDLVYDSSRRVIYASATDRAGILKDSIAVIDPVKGGIVSSMPVGVEPDNLALSDDGRYLYVGVDSTDSVRRYDLQSGTADQDIALNKNDGSYLAHAANLAVPPGQPRSVAVNMAYADLSPSAAGVRIYDDGVMRQHEIPDGLYGVIAFGSDATRLYGTKYDTNLAGTGFAALNADAAGLTETSLISNIWIRDASSVKYSNGQFFFPSGEILDEKILTKVGAYSPPSPNPRAPSLIEPDRTALKTFFLVTQDNENYKTLLAFDQVTMKQTNSLSFYVPFINNAVYMGAQDTTSGLIRWGADGLAFRASDQVILIRTNQRLPAHYGDLNRNGKMDVGDATLLLRAVVGAASLDPDQRAAADMDGDGKLTIADVVLLLRAITGS